MSADLAHPATTVPFIDEHDHEPSVGHDLRSWVMLALIAVGDIVAFSVVLMRVFADSPAVVGIGLTFAASAASILLMHEAGSRARAIRANSSAHGWRPVVLLTLAWLSLGLTAFAVRIHVETTVATSGFGSTAAETATVLDAIPSALLLLVIFLAGGVGAYVVGFRSYNPARAAVFRLRRRLWFANRTRLRQQEKAAQFRSQRDTVAVQIEAASQRAEREVGQLRHQADLLSRRGRVWLLDGAIRQAAADRTAAEDRVTSLRIRIAETDTELRTRTDGAAHRAQLDLVKAQAGKLKELARIEIAKGTGEPGATTGLLHSPSAAPINGHRPHNNTNIGRNLS